MRVQINVCPELESKLELGKSRPTPVRRFSVCKSRTRKIAPKRRQTIDVRSSDATISGIFAFSLFYSLTFRSILSDLSYVNKQQQKYDRTRHFIAGIFFIYLWRLFSPHRS